MFVIIVGGGKTGSYLAGLLLAEGHAVRVIEDRPAVLERLRQEHAAEVIVAGDGSAPSVLEAAGVATADVLAAVTGTDETNLVVTTLGRFEFNVPRVIGRVNNPKNAWLFTADFGVDVVLNQAELMARLIQEEMSLGDMMTLLKLRRGEVAIVEEKIAPESPVVGKTLQELALPENCTLAAVLRKEEVLVPRGSTRLQVGDEVLAVVRSGFQRQLSNLLNGRVGE
ncbi:MAG: TrkA family potassium uptake protein [Anaerolineae bacterium]|nr:TrkA family potassium uptake protein [Anaerolineae bacterium]